MRKIICSTIIFCFFAFNFSFVFAQTFEEQFNSGLKTTGINTGHLDAQGDTTSFFGGSDSLAQAIGYIIRIILSFLGVGFLLLMIYGGFTWMTARGNEQEAEKAKSTLTNATIGLIIILAAYAITAFVPRMFGAIG